MKTSYRRRAAALTLATALAASVATVAVGSPASAAEQTVTSEEVTYTFVVGQSVGDPGGKLVLDVGHTDAIAPVFDDGELVIQTKDDTRLYDPGIVFRNPEDLIFEVLPSSQIAVPDVPAYAFLGTAGDPVWMLPMTQNPALLWPGWSTEHASLAGQFANMQFHITNVTGPGQFHLFLNDAFGNPIHRANSLGTLSNTWTEPVPAHVHSNWAFTQPGTYEITFQVQGTWLNAPDPDPDPDPDPTTNLSISGVQGQYAPGDAVTLTAVQDPPIGGDHYHWFVQPPGESEFLVINAATSDTYTFNAIAEDDGVQFLVRLYDESEALLAESAPVTINVSTGTTPPPPPELSQTITATLSEDEGALVVSVDPNDRDVVMGPFSLATSGDYWESTGELRPVQVTDTRSGLPGWSVAGQVSDFTSGANTVGAQHLGWTPQVSSQSDGQGAVAGAPVAPGIAAGEGLSTSRGLASAPAGAGLGTATAGGELDLHLPTSAEAGTYTALLTLTAI
ncbi:MAG TPA: choice-of-anchor M domain-containing protein [Ilumatobacter sp.]|nr:choice-of-anchor M domain-containing protein [Ilumatobacter sp.]